VRSQVVRHLRRHWAEWSLVLLTAAALPVLWRLDLGLDEAYYWYWSRHPDLGYLDHPPLIAWLLAASGTLFGDTEAGLRLGGFLTMALGFAFAWGSLRELFPERGPALAWQGVALLNLTLILPGAGLIQTPDTPLFACWMAALYCGARIVARGEARAWYGLGLALGLGMLGKYTMVLFVPGMLAFLILCPAQRGWLARKEPWLAALLALAVFSPVLIWNAQHHWLSFRFQWHNGLAPAARPVADKLLDFFAAQAGVASPLLFLALLGYGLAGVRRARREPAYAYLALLSFPVLGFFAWTTARGQPAEANWPGAAYIAGMLLTWAVYARHYSARRLHRRLMAVVLGVSLVLGLTVRLHLGYQILPIPPQRDRLREFFGWDALGARVKAEMAAHPSPRGWFLLGDKGTMVAEAIYYSGGRLEGMDPRRPNRYLFLGDPNARFLGRDAIVVARPGGDVQALYGHGFQGLRDLGPYVHRYRGVPVPKYSARLWLGRRFLGFDRPRPQAKSSRRPLPPRRGVATTATAGAASSAESSQEPGGANPAARPWPRLPPP